MKILDRYVMSEMLSPFLFGLCTFTLLFFSAETLTGVAKMMLESDAGVWAVLEYLYNRLPYILVMTCPMSILLSALMAYGRLSGESEIVALKAGGVGFMRIFAPGLAFCFLVALAALAINQYWVPPTMKHAYDMLLKMQAPDQIERALISSPRQLANGEEQMVYAHSLNVKAQTMKGVFLHYFLHNKRIREVYADEARWNAAKGVWDVKDMRVSEFDPNNGNALYEASTLQAWTALSKEESPGSPDQLARRKLRPEEMSRGELAAYLNSLPPAEKTDPDAYRKRNKYAVMYYQKISLPLTCLVFGAFAIPLGIKPQRTSTSIGFGLSLLFILLYYVLMTIGTIFGESGTVSPWFAAWLPNLVFAVVAIVMVLDASRK